MLVEVLMETEKESKMEAVSSEALPPDIGAADSPVKKKVEDAPDEKPPTKVVEERIYKFKFDAEKFISSHIAGMGLDQKYMKHLSQMNTQLKSVERKQREINKILNDCSDMMAQHRSLLEREEPMIVSKCGTKSSYLDAVETVEISDDEEDVELIETTYDPELAAKRQARNVSAAGSSNITNITTLRAALTEALKKNLPPLQPGVKNSLSPLLGNMSKPIFMKPTPGSSLIADDKKVELTIGTKVLAKKFNDIWYKGTILDIQNRERGDYQQKFKVKFDGKGMKFLTGKHVAYYESCQVPIRVGSRIVVSLRMDSPSTTYRDEEATPSISFYAGIVAEVPTNRNRHRYLIFFDDGYAQYCTPKEIHKVYEQSENVWDDIHPDSQEFIREYLAQYPERPMVQLQKGQILKTEWMGKWWTAKVMDVDASLVKMYFAADKRSEWIYRGSTRLEPLYSALAKAEHNKLSGIKGRRHNLEAPRSSFKKPVVEYTRVSEDLKIESLSVSMKSTRGHDASSESKKRSVAKKSTTATSEGEEKKTWEAPWLKIQRRPPPTLETLSAEKRREQYQTSSISSNKVGRDMASVLQERLADTDDVHMDDEALGERMDINTCVLPSNVVRKKLVPHFCTPACIKDINDDPSRFRGTNPLLLPMLCGWERQVTKLRMGGKRNINYRAPCARRLRNLEEVDKYLEMTDSGLTIDLFSFEPNLYTHTEFVPVKTFCDIKDLSYGKETVPISCVNGIDRHYPDYVEYSNQRIPAKGVKLNLDTDFLICCDCEDRCRDPKKCACLQLSIEATSVCPGGKSDPKVGFEYRRLKEPLLTGIYECNPRCKCDYRCHNRVAQNGLQLRLQVFKTENRGWGLRCLDDIPAGGFICIYAGQLLTEQGANEDGQQYGDEYLAELDYIEVVEKHKEGYESDVVYPEGEEVESNSDVDDSDDDSLSSGSSDRVKLKQKPEGTDEEKVGKLVLKRESNSKDKEWSIKFQDPLSEKKIAKIADWVDSIPNDPIVIDDDEEEMGSHPSALSKDKSAEPKKDNIFSIMEEKKGSEDDVMEIDELPDLEPSDDKKPKIEEKVKAVYEQETMESVDSDESKAFVKKVMPHKCSRATTTSRFKNLPNPKSKTPVRPLRINLASLKDSAEKGDKKEEKEQRPSTRYYFNDGQLCYVMDAKSMGNIGRYLNHSCSPNVFVQNVFVDTHDLRFPWVAFFAGQYVRAGTELTWDYNYEVGSVPGKVLYCYCGSAECRGRLL